MTDKVFEVRSLEVSNSSATANLVPNSLTIGGTIVNTLAFTIGANVYLSTANLFIGNSTVNLFSNSLILQLANSTTTANLNAGLLTLGANVQLSVSSLNIGNSLVNTFINSSTIRVISLIANATLGTNSQVLMTNGTVAFWSSSYEQLGQFANINQQTASYTLVLTDKGKTIEMNVASNNTLTVPNNATVAFPNNSFINITQIGAGQTTLTAGSGVTLNSRTGLRLVGQWSTAVIYKRDTDNWVCSGDLLL